MNSAILARVQYRLRTSDLLSIDWDEDEAAAHTHRSRPPGRGRMSDATLRGTDDDDLRAFVRQTHREKDDRTQERVFKALLRRRARLVAQAERVARSARAAITPNVHAVKARAMGTKEGA